MIGRVLASRVSWPARSFDAVAALVRTGAGVVDGMARLLRFCEREHRHPAWEAFHDLDFGEELARLEGWLTACLRAEPPPTTTTAFLFGLFNPVDAAGQKTADLYVAGSPGYWPALRYAASQALEDIYLRAHDDPGELGEEAEYPLVLGYGALVAAHLCRTLPPALLLAGAAERPVLVGFDDGDQLQIGVVEARGLRIN